MLSTIAVCYDPGYSGLTDFNFSAESPRKTLIRKRKTCFSSARHFAAGRTRNVPTFRRIKCFDKLNSGAGPPSLIAAMLFTIPGIVTAQTTTTGAINGTIQDPSGASVGGASIQCKE